MPAFDLFQATADPIVEDLVEIGIYVTGAQAAEHGLVVLAAGHPYWLVEASEGFRLMVEREAAGIARLHLAAYDRESTRWPPPPIVDPWTPGKADLITPLLWAVLVLALFYLEGKSPAWTERGALDARAVWTSGEWWRVVTALFLHADATHVTSNVVGGLLVFPAVLSTFGRLHGWGVVLISSIAANVALAVANRTEPYISLGASTAIFAAVGLLAGRAVCVGWRSTHPHRSRAMFAPLAAGLTVLALYGAGGLNVDVGAHLAGFLAGLGVGFLAILRTLPK